MININSHTQKEKSLVLVPTPRGETMWVHPDIVESQQQTIVTNRKSKGKTRAFSSNIVSISTRKTEEDVASPTSLGEEESAFAANTGAPPTSKA